jgi:sugar phosphate isomerase/epimerase
LAPYINTLVAKDFRWRERDGAWKTENCPLGQGMVDFTRYFKMLRQANISAPVSLHLEYPLGGAERGARRLTASKQAVLEAMRRDLSFLRKQ